MLQEDEREKFKKDTWVGKSNHYKCCMVPLIPDKKRFYDDRDS